MAAGYPTTDVKDISRRSRRRAIVWRLALVLRLTAEMPSDLSKLLKPVAP
jgi:hypothetical protein